MTWHVDNLKVSHVKEKEETGFCTQLGDIYECNIKVNHEKLHLYLGMDFNYSTNKIVRLSMIPYAKKAKMIFPRKSQV